MNFTNTFTVIRIISNDNTIKIELVLKELYNLKQIANSTRIFSNRGVEEIILAYSGSLKRSIGTFSIIADYHCIAGERPSAMLRQIAKEHGACLWIARNTINMETFSKLISKTHDFEYHYNKETEYTIIKYYLTSNQNELEEKNIRSFTGWCPSKGRIKSSLTSLALIKKSVAPIQQSVLNTYSLSNSLVNIKEVVDFTCIGNASLTAGIPLKLLWHKSSLESPINEALPEKILIKSVSHWFKNQKYYCRIKGAVKLEQA